jgi:molecular chaperone DnaK
VAIFTNHKLQMSSDYIVGIDLGTTNSLVAYMQGDSPTVIPGEDGLNLVPSVVALDEKNQVIVGNAARKFLIETSDRAVYSVKRLMGRGVEDVKEELKLFPFRIAEDIQTGEVLRIKIGERTYTPPEISALILRQLKRNAERFFGGGPVTKAVITPGHERRRTHRRARRAAPRQ